MSIKILLQVEIKIVLTENSKHFINLKELKEITDFVLTDADEWKVI